MRFEVITKETGYKVRDIVTGKFVGYSYGKPLYENEGHNLCFVWSNYYSARGFAQKMDAMNNGTGKCVA